MPGVSSQLYLSSRPLLVQAGPQPFPMVLLGCGDRLQITEYPRPKLWDCVLYILLSKASQKARLRGRKAEPPSGKVLQSGVL